MGMSNDTKAILSLRRTCLALAVTGLLGVGALGCGGGGSGRIGSTSEIQTGAEGRTESAEGSVGL
jgi:hypothetical protein